MTLAELRRATGHTQVQVAEATGWAQNSVSRLERQHDLHLSTLRAYVAATGGQLRIIASYPSGDQHELHPGRDA